MTQSDSPDTADLPPAQQFNLTRTSLTDGPGLTRLIDVSKLPVSQSPDLAIIDAKRQTLIEWTASVLAWGVLTTFSGSIFILIAYARWGDSATAIDLLKVLLPATSTPLGVALGYYFTQQRRNAGPDRS